QYNLLPNDVADEWMAFIRMSVRNSQHIIDLAKKYKIKVPDARDSGFWRDVIGASGFEMKLDASPKLNRVFDKMANAGWDVKAPSYIDTLNLYLESREGLSAHLNPLFAGDIWDDFVREFAMDPD